MYIVFNRTPGFDTWVWTARYGWPHISPFSILDHTVCTLKLDNGVIAPACRAYVPHHVPSRYPIHACVLATWFRIPAKCAAVVRFDT